VSVSGKSVVNEKKGITPSWKEMCFIKDLFFHDNEVVLQFHPAKKDYVNIHDNCLHLWRNRKSEIILPPKGYV